MTTPSQSRLIRGVFFSALLFTVVDSYSMRGQESVAGQAAGLFGRRTLTGDWAGLRSTLEQAGIRLRADFTAESAANPSGGRRQSAAYAQEVEFGADLDLNRWFGDPGAMVQITFNDRLGRSLSADAIGNLFDVQQVYGGGQTFRISELNYQQTLFSDKLNFQVGWSPAGDYFASLPVFCAFQSGFICGHLNPMTTNSGAHNAVVGQWGARVRVNPTPQFYAQTAIYQVNPDAEDPDKGLDLSFSGTGVLVPFELGWLPGNRTGKFPGIYKVGGYYNSSETPDVLTGIHGLPAGLTRVPFATHSGRLGAYGMADQIILRDGSNPKRVLRAGATGGVADRATAMYRWFFAVGGVRQGTLKHRDSDFVSVLFADARINPRLTRYQQDRDAVTPGTVDIQTHESIAEVDYNVQISPWLSVRPNLQYVIRPGGSGKISNAVVIGLHIGLTF